MGGMGQVLPPDSVVAAFMLYRDQLFHAKWMLWILLLSIPFPYIANTAGWMTAELGRQPWLVYGLMRTADGYSKNVSAGNGMFTLLGFMGLYTLLGILFLLLIRRGTENGALPPATTTPSPAGGKMIIRPLWYCFLRRWSKPQLWL